MSVSHLDTEIAEVQMCLASSVWLNLRCVRTARILFAEFCFDHSRRVVLWSLDAIELSQPQTRALLTSLTRRVAVTRKRPKWSTLFQGGDLI